MQRDAATSGDLRVIHQLFVDHDKITRTVTNLPNGIRTVTESNDPRIAQLLKEHVASMGQRVAQGRDPGLPIESSALHAIFRDRAKIHTQTAMTAKGVVVTQTSSDPRVVAELQQHAAQVSDFVREGMVAVRNAMMKNGPGGMMGDGMMAHGMMMQGGMTMHGFGPSQGTR